MNLINFKFKNNPSNLVSSFVDKTKILAIDLSLSKLSLAEVAKLVSLLQQFRSRFNKKRNLLLLEFSDPQQKVIALKLLPQWAWNRGAVLWETSNHDLQEWVSETLLD
ncbi:hypothetical protein [Kaarinaea lacus]